MQGTEARRGSGRQQASFKRLCRSRATSVVLNVDFGSFGSVVGGVFMVSLGEDGMVSGFFMVSGFVVLGRFTVMSSSVFVMLGGDTMMFRSFLGHIEASPLEIWF